MTPGAYYNGEDNSMTDKQLVSWQAQIEINGRWCGDGSRFESERSALDHAQSAAARRAWRATRGKSNDRIGAARAVPTNDPVNREQGFPAIGGRAQDGYFDLDVGNDTGGAPRGF
jgi:hypothetical protein